MKERMSGRWSMGLSDEEKTIVFAIAENTLEWCVNGGKEPFSFDIYNITEKLKEHTATFVTLRINKELRGCIGSILPEEPLYMSIHNNAVNAALRDPRFSPVASFELALIKIDLSMLSLAQPISSIQEFKIGEHGIIMKKGMRRAVFLPEVAVEQNWTRDETLSQLSIKAGLPADGWKSSAEFYVFESVVLSME